MAAIDLLQVKTAEEVSADVRAAEAEAGLVAQPTPALLSHVQEVFDRNKRHRETENVTNALVSSLQQYNNEYSADKLAKIEQAGQTPIFMGITGVKSRAAMAWLTDIFANEQEKTWSFRPSPAPEVPPEDLQQAMMEVAAQVQAAFQQGAPPSPDQVRQLQTKIEQELRDRVTREATQRAEQKEVLVHDQMVQGGFQIAFQQFLMDMVVLKAGILKGPVVRRVKAKHWNGPEMVVVPEDRPWYTSVSPFDAFPSPNDTDFEYDFIERVRIPRQELYELRDVQGYDAAAIESVLASYDAKRDELADLQGDSDRADLEIKESPLGGLTNAADSELVYGLDCWLSVPGSLLMDYGMLTGPDRMPLEPLKEYNIEVLKVSTYLVYVGFNKDPLGRKPYTKMGWSEIPRSFWYDGVPELMADLQQVCNACARSLVYNMGIASGPQTVITDVNRLPEGEDVTGVFPGKVWQFVNRNNSTVPPLIFEQPSSNANELLAVFDRFLNLADDWTGIPAYSYGNDQVAGAGRTFGGLSMLMSNASKGIKRVILDIDKKVFRRLLELQSDWNMQYLPAYSAIGGDIEIVPAGAVALMAKEAMSDRRMTFLRETANPTDLQIMGAKGRALLLREAAKTLELPGQKVVRDDEVIDAEMQQQQQAAQQAQESESQLNQAKAQSEMQRSQAEIALKQAELELRREEMQIQLQLKQMDIQLKQMDLQIKAKQAETAEAREDLKLEKELRSDAGAETESEGMGSS